MVVTGLEAVRKRELIAILFLLLSDVIPLHIDGHVKSKGSSIG
jgi:hypothetical protein